MEKDWRLERLEEQEYLPGIRLQRMRYREYRPDWDHDHCVACWAKFTVSDFPEQPTLHEGYTTCSDFEQGAEYWWVCPGCFSLFREAMGWTEVASSPKLPCYETIAFDLYDAGYLGLGRDCTGVYLDDFWQYEPSADEWFQKPDFPGDARYYAKAESFAGLGFVGTGQNESGVMLNDFWSYDPIQNEWFSLPDLPGESRRGLASCSIPYHGA